MGNELSMCKEAHGDTAPKNSAYNPALDPNYSHSVFHDPDHPLNEEK